MVIWILMDRFLVVEVGIVICQITFLPFHDSHINRIFNLLIFPYSFSSLPNVHWIPLKVLSSFLFSLSFLVFNYGKRTTRSHTNVIVVPDDDFVDHKALSYEENCTFDDNDIKDMKSDGAFPIGTVFRSFDARIQPDFVSSSWLCLPEYPFILGLSYLFLVLVLSFSILPKSHISKPCHRFGGSFTGSIDWTARWISGLVWMN